MDTSETYIKMRLKAVPDLGMGEPPDFAVGMEWITSMVCIDGKGDWYYFTDSDSVQLERQDQLQEMVRNLHPFELVDKFYSFCMWDELLEDCRENLLPTSMEQLWLAFVMSKLYGKIWNGESWKTDI